ncbi:hypothetical protein Rhe02_02930 [Rhizocola hellebori]|uniref:Uncharacterized protein n=1 Tax=Rhizocola hellebori TaxID=1392758 RepID=A0A8J3Q2M1_9ACTN|nr:hypothetical protein [Rhizocola hellebori]GIH02226.1 hypothetical protein Rhe02_02930 [Rhizocola hellebori]
MTTAALSFLPWVRQGAAAAIAVPDDLGLPSQNPVRPVAAIAATLTLHDGPSVPAPPITLRGPADVAGFHANQVVRTDPRPSSTDFEANCFPSVEFDRPDFPWLFTPAKADGQNRLRPWLCLVVVENRPGVTVNAAADGPLAVLRIAAPASPAVELPDLKDSWAWAHAQASTADTGEGAVLGALGDPARGLSRLVCPRFLAADTDYLACVVPTFEVGRKSGLGLPITPADVDPATGVLTPAWSLASGPVEVVLPVYFQWSFRTGPAGDFASLAGRLQPGVPAGLGTRTIDIGQPGFPASGVSIVELDGALAPIGPTPADPIPLAYKTSLAGVLNGPAGQPAQVLAPPIYGRWPAGVTTVAPAGTTWVDQLNVDPRRRIAAALGTRVVQEHQEALMASAWDQAAQVREANQRLRQMQLSLAVSRSLYRKNLAVLSEEQILRVAAPAFGRIWNGDVSILAEQTGSALQAGANQAAMRRIGRQRGPLSRRVLAKGPQPRSATDTWVARLNEMPGTVVPAPPPPPAADRVPFPAALALARNRISPTDTQSSFGVFFVAAENAPVSQPGNPVVDTSRTELPDFFRHAAGRNWDRFFPVRDLTPPPQPVALQSIRELVLAQTEPGTTLRALAGAIVGTGDSVLAPTPPGISGTGLETVMTGPSFPQPMYEPLRELSQDLFLPGLEKIQPDTVLGLQTNRAFVESYLVGLNHEMGRELLWRGYPTDQRGTCFAHFWGLGVPNAAPADITDLVTWKARGLASSTNAPQTGEQFVMVIRSSLLARYPNATIYLTPAIHPGSPPDLTRIVPDEAPAHEQLPLFSGALQPDIAFFGFAVSTAQATGADGGPGYYVVIQEHPTEPRFGLDVGYPHTGSHLALGPQAPTGSTAAQLAAQTRRRPVRLALHASRLITHA